MGVQERRMRERQERERRIIECARAIADSEGWSAVTTRRLANEIEYSPPVLYGHFPDGRDGIVNAVAIAGFGDFATTMRAVLDDDADDHLTRFITAYLDFSAGNPATYEAMFSMQLEVRFADESTPAELRDAFGVLVDAVGGEGSPDAETRAELLWSALHGMSVLSRTQRLRPDNAGARIDELTELFGNSAVSEK
ncbi:WHG domain-containing protein [Gordonia sp. CPCC 205515]|uniref:TetR/AcrR family transcriptional regulator n=1 Tax=Gordonia sp. CPCC 205515 TaxID=3140791 RepID=UPI003AF3AE8B